MKAYIKNLTGLNKAHFDKHGRIYEVEMIDYALQEVTVRTPSQLDFEFKDVKLLRDTGAKDSHGKAIYEDDILQSNCKWAVYWDINSLSWKVRLLEETEEPYQMALASLAFKLNKIKIIGNINEQR